jgi:hypothetical protein
MFKMYRLYGLPEYLPTNSGKVPKIKTQQFFSDRFSSLFTNYPLIQSCINLAADSIVTGA